MTDANLPKKKQVPFFEILKQAARIVWENRYLLWFGFLIALGSPGSFNIGSREDWDGRGGEAIKHFAESHWQVLAAAALVFFAIGIGLYLASLIAKAGLIRSVYIINQGKKTSFREGWQFGKQYLGKFFLLFLLLFLATFVVTVVLAVPIVFLVVAKSWIAAILVGLLAVAILIPLMIIFTLTEIYAEFYIVLSNLGLRSAIESGYNLLHKNIGNSILFGLLLLAVSIAAGIVLLPVVTIALLILIPSGIAFYYLSKIAFAAFLFVAIAIFLVVVLFVSSVFKTFKITCWTLFFQEIAKVEKPEPEKEIAEEIEKSIAATPEKA